MSLSSITRMFDANSEARIKKWTDPKDYTMMLISRIFHIVACSKFCTFNPIRYSQCLMSSLRILHHFAYFSASANQQHFLPNPTSLLKFIYYNTCVCYKLCLLKINFHSQEVSSLPRTRNGTKNNICAYFSKM